MARVSANLRIQNAVNAAKNNERRFTRATRNTTNNGTRQPGSYRDTAEKLGVTKAAVEKAMRPKPAAKRGRPPLITPEEEAGLVAYVVWLERSGFPAERSQVEEAAREFRLSRGFPDSPFNKNWYSQFRGRHQELKTSHIKAVDKARKSYENNDIQNTETFFDNLKSTVEELDIGPSEMWNEDECSIRIGCLRERIQVLIVRTTRAQRPEVSDPNNRETTSLLGAGNAVGDTIPPWLIFKAFPTESWLEIDCVPGMRFAKSETGFSNRDIAFEWLHHFNVESWNASAKAQKTGLSLEECSKFNELLNQKPDGFMIDIPESQELRRARQRASKAPRPILAMDFPKSDDTVTFTGLGPFNDEDDEDKDTLVDRGDSDDQDDTQFDSLPPFMKSSPPAEVIEVIDPDTPCPRQPPPQLPPPSQPRQRWKTLTETVRVMRANLNNDAGQSHRQIGS
ncbi:hypothetical protein LRP88_02040 [Fusarium phalaenopsidis]